MPSYEEEKASFEGLNAQVLGISVDHIPCLEAWSESLGGITYPLLSDFWPHGATADLYGVFRRDEGITERAIFVLDRRGVVRYIDIHDIADRPDNEVLRQVLRQIEREETEVEAVRSAGAAAASAGVYYEPPEESERPQGDILLYCARWCKDCRKAKAWLDERGLAYVEIDIDYDMAARARVRQWAGGRLVTPVIDFDGAIILDFDEPRLEAALRKRQGR